MSKIVGSIKIGNERFDLISGEYTPQTRYWNLSSAYQRLMFGVIGNYGSQNIQRMCTITYQFIVKTFKCSH